MFATETRPAEDCIDREAVASAVRRYLVATRSASADAYARVEEAAWRELVLTLARNGRPLTAS